MIRYVKLNNYKSLTNLHVDFMKTKAKPKNIILIYGENGVGKSNFANAFYTLSETMRTMSSIEILKHFAENREEILKRKNLKEEDYKELLEDYLKPRFKDIKMIIRDNKTIGSKENMVLEYGFTFKNKNGVYRIEMNDTEIVAEKLEYVMNKNQVCFFDIKHDNIKINTNVFIDNDYYSEFYNLIEKYWGKHSFLSILSYEVEDKKRGYVKSKISSSLYYCLSYLKTIFTKIKGGNHKEFGTLGTRHNIITELRSGIVPITEEAYLSKVECMLNDFFSNLYSDIKKVYYEKEIIDKRIRYNLMVKKVVYGKILDIDFNLESTGTQNILDLLPYLIAVCEGRPVIIDELDAGIHDLLVSNILENISKYIQGQLIITTHNTMLIESSIPNENIYVFKLDRNAEKELIPITDFNGRIHKNINPRKKYLNGMYGGVPMISDIDFDELIDNLK